MEVIVTQEKEDFHKSMEWNGKKGNVCSQFITERKNWKRLQQEQRLCRTRTSLSFFFPSLLLDEENEDPLHTQRAYKC